MSGLGRGMSGSGGMSGPVWGCLLVRYSAHEQNDRQV